MPASASDPAVDEILIGLDRLSRLEMPGEAPSLSLPAARWAAELLHAACRLLVHRDLDAKEVQRALERQCPAPLSPSTVYSVDLLFRHLPAVYCLARGFAPDDPLVAAIKKLAQEWPFSSVGMIPVEALHLDGLGEHSSLRQEFLDRLLASGGQLRLLPPQLALEAALSSAAPLEERERILASGRLGEAP
jgi:hypothetical protein